MTYDSRNYPGAAVVTIATTALDPSGLTFVVADATGWPTSNFVVALDPGTSTEEKVLVVTRVGTTCTIESSIGRGYDSTTPQSHQPGAVARCGWDATSAQEANKAVVETVGRVAAKGDLLLGSGVNALTKLAVGANGLPLQADSSTPAGASWQTLDQAVTHDAPDTDVAAGSLHHTLGTTALKAAAGNHDHNTPGSGYLQTVPAGVINPFAGAAAPSGWLLCDGTAVSRATYAALFAVTGTTYGTGDGSTTFNLPNLKGRVPVGIDAGQAEFDVRGETGGAKTVTLASTDLPPHAHAIDHDHAAFTSGAGSAHSHVLPIQYATNTTFTGSGTRVADIQGSTGGGGSAANPATNTESAHTHQIDVPALVGNSGNGPGASNPVNNLQPYLALNFIIKA